MLLRYYSFLNDIGNEAVDWLITKERIFSREESVKLGQKLMDLHLIQHVARQQPFLDKNFYYEFVESTIDAISSAMRLDALRIQRKTIIDEISSQIFTLVEDVKSLRAETDVLQEKFQ